ncbi:hypothetical protein MJ904_20505 [Massilia sp. MB5]|uniref:4'-phosphopantetheinyl transferase family protein n=1 Tax=Massilia sp. MB5 TaxID=2919578 RepID=UPI001F0FF0A5|nr:hypothetical protein [Massilia sp. MB5]UMR29429.1 hypothetical protein MJ904_20505 [Massilia sp. MB5]
MHALFNPLIPRHSWPPGVDLWCSGWQVLGDSVRQGCAAALSAEERDRMKGFLIPGAADQFLLARALLRTALSHYTGLPAAGWRFRTGEHGKPYLCGPAHGGPALHFNLSHCNGMVVCAVTTISAASASTSSTPAAPWISRRWRQWCFRRRKWRSCRRCPTPSGAATFSRSGP